MDETKKQDAEQDAEKDLLAGVADAALCDRIEAMVTASESGRAIWMPYWYDLEQKWLGNFYLVYVKSLNIFQTIKTDPGRTQRVINKVRSQVRGVKNLITKSPPAWEVTPDLYNDEANTEAKVAGYVLSHIYDRSSMRPMMGDTVWYGLMRSVGWLEAAYDPDKELPFVRSWDAFDILTSPGATDETDTLYIIKVIPKTISSIKSNSNYETANLKVIPDNRTAVTPTKEYLMTYQSNKASNAVSLMDTILLYECWIKEVADDGTVSIRVVTKVGKNILRDEDTGLTEFPFVAYKPERKPNSLYTIPWMQAIVDSNKALIRLLNQAEDYATKLQAGWIIKPKRTKASKIFNMTGAVIEYEGPAAPIVAPVPPMPRSLLELVGYHERAIEDLAGIHSESMGRIQGTDRSGVALARLQAADVNNVGEPIVNMEDTLTRLGHKLLMLVSKHWTTIKDIPYIKDGVEMNAKVVGESAPEALKGQAEVTVIKDFDKIRVSILPWSAFSDAQQREDASELFRLGVFQGDTGRQAVLEAYRWGGVRQLIERMKNEALPPTDPDVQEAEAENMKMKDGQPVQVAQTQNHQMHMLMHSNFLKSQPVMQNDQLKAAVVQHMREHETMMQQSQPIQAGINMGGPGGQVIQR